MDTIKTGIKWGVSAFVAMLTYQMLNGTLVGLQKTIADTKKVEK